VLRKASDDGIIDEKIIALGGVTLDKIPYLKELNFGGVAMVGAIYNISSINCMNNIYR
jgi:thiamine-phosphate pyrophosphorylase